MPKHRPHYTGNNAQVEGRVIDNTPSAEESKSEKKTTLADVEERNKDEDLSPRQRREKYLQSEREYVQSLSNELTQAPAHVQKKVLQRLGTSFDQAMPERAVNGQKSKAAEFNAKSLPKKEGMQRRIDRGSWDRNTERTSDSNNYKGQEQTKRIEDKRRKNARENKHPGGDPRQASNSS